MKRKSNNNNKYFASNTWEYLIGLGFGIGTGERQALKVRGK